MELVMTPFQLVFAAVLSITILNSIMAGCIVMFGKPEQNSLQKKAVANLLEIAKLSTVAIIGLLGGMNIPS